MLAVCLRSRFGRALLIQTPATSALRHGEEGVGKTWGRGLKISRPFIAEVLMPSRGYGGVHHGDHRLLSE